jgi:hypothetical protein
VLRPFADSLVEADGRLAGRVGRDEVAAIVEQLPDDWLGDDPAIGGPVAQRRAYVDYLATRLRAPRPFLAEGSSAVA